MSLVPFLRGALPRRTPADAPWRILHRHAEGGPWTVVASAGTEEGLEEEGRAGWRGWAVPGATAGDPAAFMGPQGEGRECVLRRDGRLADLPGVWTVWTGDLEGRRWMQDRGWVGVWEDCPRGEWMARAVDGGVVSQRRAETAAYELARRISRLAPGDRLCRGARAAMRAELNLAMSRRHSDEGDLAECREDAWVRRNSPGDPGVVALADAMYRLMSAFGWDANPMDSIAQAVGRAALAAREEVSGGVVAQAARAARMQRDAADILRRTIPLRVVLLGLVQDSDDGDDG